MKKGLTISMVTIAMTILLAVPAFAASQPIKVGAIFAITGGASFLGEPERNAAKMFEEQTNAAGGINGAPLDIVIYDTESNGNNAVLRLKRLIQRDRVAAVVGPTTSGNTMAVIPVAEDAGMPLVSCAASIKIVEPVKKWIFKTPQTDTSAVEAIFMHLKKAGLNKVAILTVNDGYGKSGREQLKNLAPKFGMHIVADELFGPKDTSMEAQLTKIRDTTDAQALVCWTIGPAQVTVMKNFKGLGMEDKMRFYQSHGFGSKQNIRLAGGAAEGVIAPLGRVVVADIIPADNPQKKFVLNFKTLYEMKFNTEVSTFGGHAWDALTMVGMAISAVGTDKAKIRDYLEGITGFAGTGGMFNMSPTDHCGLDYSAFEMIKVKGGNWSLAD